MTISKWQLGHCKDYLENIRAVFLTKVNDLFKIMLLTWLSSNSVENLLVIPVMRLPKENEESPNLSKKIQ